MSNQIICCNRSNQMNHDELEASGLVEESEVVEELLKILVECLKKKDVRSQELLLRKFFFEIEKETSMERFLVQRTKDSKLNILCRNLDKNGGDHCEKPQSDQMEMMSSREVDVSSLSEDETLEKLERFKVKTIKVGEIVKEDST